MTHTNNTTVFRLLAISLLMGAALAGCLAQDSEAASGELYVKDQLTDEAAEVYVTFNKAEALPAQGQGWVSVFEGEETIEMLSLSGPDDKARLSEFELQPGEYLQLRISITNVTVVDHDGNETEYTTFGNVVTIGHNLTVSPGGDFEVLVDFDLENGIDLANREYVPVVGFAQTTQKDDDGRPTETNRTERPEQSNSIDRNGVFGICTAWTNSETGRMQGNATNSTSFQWLREQADEANQTVDAYCEEHARPGAPSSLKEVLPEHMPEQAREALQDRRLGPAGDAGRPDGAGTGGSPGGQGNETAGPGPGNNPGQGGGNQTGGNQSGGPPS